MGIEIGDSKGSYSYIIDDSVFPAPAQGLTLVMCEEKEYMMGQRGINFGGISVLVNNILVDYSNKRVGFKAEVNAPAGGSGRRWSYPIIRSGE